MGRRVPLLRRRVPAGGLPALRQGLPPRDARAGPRTEWTDRLAKRLLGASPPCAGPEQGAPELLSAEGPRRARPLPDLLGVPLVHTELCDLHLRRLRMAAVLDHAALRDRGADIRRLPRSPGRGTADRGRMGRGAPLGRDAETPELRPDSEARGRHHSRPDRRADGAHPVDRGLPRGGGRRRAGLRAHRFRAGRPSRPSRGSARMPRR